jgi:hypothetical protein
MGLAVTHGDHLVEPSDDAELLDDAGRGSAFRLLLPAAG